MSWSIPFAHFGVRRFFPVLGGGVADHLGGTISLLSLAQAKERLRIIFALIEDFEQLPNDARLSVAQFMAWDLAQCITEIDPNFAP